MLLPDRPSLPEGLQAASWIQSQRVLAEAFLQGNDLPRRWHTGQPFVIFQSAFGVGTQFLEVWAQWRKSPGCRLFFIGVEEAPVSDQDFPAHHFSQDSTAPLARLLHAQWPVRVSGIHRLEFDDRRVTLLLAFGATSRFVNLIHARVNAFFLPVEPSATARQMPRLWLRKLARIAANNATITVTGLSATECEHLSGSGFGFKLSPGCGAAAGMYSGGFLPERRETRHQNPVLEGRSAVVVGAGLAGTAAAASLSQRGWEVTLVERQFGPATQASGNMAAVMAPMISKDDGIAARLSRACFFHLRSELLRLETAGYPVRWANCGVLRFAKDARAEQLLHEIAATLRLPKTFLQVLSRTEASAEIGHPAPAAACLFPMGGWVQPPSLCAARLLAHPAIKTQFGCDATEISYESNLWIVRDASRKIVANASALVLANTFEATRFTQAQFLRFKKVRGQASHLPASTLPPIHRVLSGDGYLTPSIEGLCALGATYEFDTEDQGLSATAHLSNLGRLQALLPGMSPPVALNELGGRVGFRSLTPDRLPSVGSLPVHEAIQEYAKKVSPDLPRWPHAYGVLGLGSRGLVWSSLMGETLGSLVENEPWPLESDLVHAMDPARFWMREQHCAQNMRISSKE
jgi:tRNA 5-methylaminomethyl-2-thiouridine biosynthesis bifunctional protein